MSLLLTLPVISANVDREALDARDVRPTDLHLVPLLNPLHRKLSDGPKIHRVVKFYPDGLTLRYDRLPTYSQAGSVSDLCAHRRRLLGRVRLLVSK